MAIEEVGIRLRNDGAVETASGINLAAAATGRLGQQAGTAAVPVAVLARTSGQVSQAMQQLPMQITDVVTSMASGMPVWMVAIQQGGQIRDSFGGWAPAFNAIRAAIPPMVAGVGGAAAAVGVLSTAFQMGRNESDGYVRGLLITGNQAGVTAGSLAELAAAQDQVNGTQREAAQVITQLMLAGNVSRAQMAVSLRAVIAMERELGIEAKTTVAELAKLGDDPLRAAVALHRQYGFLTMGVYEQIRALAEQGRTAEAAAVAQEAYANAGIERSRAMEEQLGLLERAWRGVKSGAGEAWDAMLGLGRQRTLQQELADIEQRLAQPVRRGGNALQADQRRDALRERRDAILEVLRLEQRSADQQAEAAAAVRAKAEADAKAERDRRNKPAPEGDRLGAFITDQLNAQQRRDDAAAERADRERQARLEQQMAFAQTLRDRNDRAAAESLRDAEARGRAILAVEERLLRQRFDMTLLNSQQRKEVEDELARWRAAREGQLHQELLEAERDRWAEQRDIWDESFGGFIDEAVDEWGRFQRSGEFSIQRVLQAWLFAQAQMKLGNLLNSLSGIVFNAATGGGAAAVGPPSDLAGGFVGPPAGLAGRAGALGRGTMVFSPTIQIDSRTDRAEILQLVNRGMETAQAQLLERMERGET